jgi:diaminopimelate decarboxylase
LKLNKSLGIKIEIINIVGGGIGIPYRPEQVAVNLEYVGSQIRKVYEELIVPAGLAPIRIAMECGRMITGPYGYLVAKALHKKEIYKNYVGLDACMADLMRPGVYGAYHHITVVGKEQQPHDRMVDVTGSLCENNDNLQLTGLLPKFDIGDLIVIHDSGAHGHRDGL